MAISVLELNGGTGAGLTPFFGDSTLTHTCGFIDTVDGDLEVGDLLVYIHTFDVFTFLTFSSTPGPPVTDPSVGVTEAAHPTTPLSSMGGTLSDWTDMGYARHLHGTTGSGQYVGVGIYVRPIGASDVKNNITCTWDTGVTASYFSGQPHTARVIVIRGADVSSGWLSDTQIVSQGTREGWDDSETIKWMKPLSGLWSTGNYPGRVLPIHVGVQNGPNLLDPTTTPDEGTPPPTLTTLTSIAVGTPASAPSSGWSIPGTPVTEDLTDPSGYAGVLQSHGYVSYYEISDVNALNTGWDNTGGSEKYWALTASPSAAKSTLGACSLTLFVLAPVVENTFDKTDSSTASDSLTLVHGHSQSSTDDLTVSDTLTAPKAATEIPTDTSTVSDTLTAPRAATISITDSSTVSDDLTAIEVGSSHTFEKTDSVTTSDALTAIETGVSHTFAETDIATISDTLTAPRAATKTLTDTSTTSDTLTTPRSATESPTDSATSSDTLTTPRSAFVLPTDTLTVSDSLTAIETGASNTFSETDTTTTSDQLTTLHVHTFIQTDTITASDTLTAQSAHTVTFTDSATTSDTLSAAGQGVLIKTDSASTSDQLTTLHSNTFSETDTATTSDTLTATEVGVSYTFDETDSVTTSDTLVTVETGVSHTFSETDTSTTSDTLTAIETGVSHTFSKTDSCTTSDTLVTLRLAINSETDTATASDILTTQSANNVTFTDSATVSDDLSAAKTGESTFSETDSVSTLDVLIAGKSQAVSFTDSVTTSDTLTTLRAALVSLLDQVSSSDQIVIVRDSILLFTDSSSVSDTLTAVEPEVIELEVIIGGTGSMVVQLLTEAQAVAVIDIWNTALSTLGISTLTSTSGSSPQQQLLDNIFDLFRQQFLADHMWNGAKKTSKLTKLTTTSTDNPALDRWNSAWDLPDDALRIWRLNGLENRPSHIGGNPNIDTNRWEIEIITISSTNYRALLTNESEAIIEYIADLDNDGLILLGPATQHAMGMALAVYMATNFGKSASEITHLDAMAKEALVAAKGIDGQEGTPQIFGDTSLLGVRSMGY